MLTTLAFAIAVVGSGQASQPATFQTQGPATAPAPSRNDAAVLISRMLRKYADAKTLDGAYRMTQSASGKSIQVDWKIAYERPGLIYVDRKPSYAGDRELALISDGDFFRYSAPSNLIGEPPMLKEKVHTDRGDITIPDMYGALRISFTVGDYLPADIAIGRTRDLRHVIDHFATFVLKGKDTINGVPVNVISGEWRDQEWKMKGDTSDRIGGTFELYVTDDGDLVKLATHMRYAVPASALLQKHMPTNAYPDGILVDSVYDIRIQVDKPINHALFHL